MSQNVFALMSDAVCLGIYSSKEELAKGVDYHISDSSHTRPLATLHYNEFEVNYSNECLGWDWCYIASDTNIKDLKESKGESNFIPMKEYWGMNLIGQEWYTDEQEEKDFHGIK